MTRRNRKDIGSVQVLRALQQTNKLLAAVIVQIARTQTARREYPIEILQGLGLRSRAIAEAIGTSEATINVTKGRKGLTRRRHKEALSDDAVDPADSRKHEPSTREK